MITEEQYRTGLTDPERRYVEDDYLRYLSEVMGTTVRLPALLTVVHTVEELRASTAGLQYYATLAAQDRTIYQETDDQRRLRVETNLIDVLKRSRILPEPVRATVEPTLKGTVRVQDPAAFARARADDLLARLGDPGKDPQMQVLTYLRVAIGSVGETAAFALPARPGRPGTLHIRTGFDKTHVQIHEAMHMLAAPGWDKEDLLPDDVWIVEGATERIALRVLAGLPLPPVGSFYDAERAKLDDLLAAIKWTDDQLLDAYFGDPSYLMIEVMTYLPASQGNG